MKLTLKQILLLLLLMSPMHAVQGARKEGNQPLPYLPASHYTYLAPNVIQSLEAVVFTSFAVTNSTPYWFNFKVYLVTREGEIARDLAPLVKGYGTWQQSSGDLILENFQGSIWIVSPHPLVGVSMNYQLRSGGELEHLATVSLEKVSGGEDTVLPGSPPLE